MAVSQGLWSRNRRLFTTWITRGGGRSNCRHYNGTKDQLDKEGTFKAEVRRIKEEDNGGPG